jgi:acyl carrier protein
MISLEEFVKAFAAEFDDTPEEVFKPDTHFRELEEWGSLTALSIISMVDDEADVVITGADIRSCTTIEDLYNLIQSK